MSGLNSWRVRKITYNLDQHKNMGWNWKVVMQLRIPMSSLYVIEQIKINANIESKINIM